MTHPLGSIRNHATDTLAQGITMSITLPVRVAARAYGVAKGAASVGVRVVREARQAPSSPWDQATTEPTPVNVVEDLDLDPAPVDTPPAPAPITSIDAQADPDQVATTPADVAERLSHSEDR